MEVMRTGYQRIRLNIRAIILGVVNTRGSGWISEDSSWKEGMKWNKEERLSSVDRGSVKREELSLVESLKKFVKINSKIMGETMKQKMENIGESKLSRLEKEEIEVKKEEKLNLDTEIEVEKKEKMVDEKSKKEVKT